MSGITHDLHQQADAARTLLLNIRDVIGDDDEAAADAVEGETSFTEACQAAVERLQELDAHDAAISAHIEKMRSRSARLQEQAGVIRAALAAGMAQAGLKKIELPTATLSRRPVAQKVIVTDEQAIPADFFKRADPTLDKKKLLAALKDNPVPGAELSNGGETIAILER